MLRRRAAGFAADRAGVSAIEFSLIAPLLLVLFMAAIEVPRAYMIAKRLDHATATMADLISRGSYADLSPVFAAVSAIANPYDTSGASIVLTAAGTYQSDGSAKAQVCSSAESNGQARAVGSSLGAPPPGMTHNGDRFVISQVSMAYRPVFPIFSFLANYTFRYDRIWPVRGGEVYFGQNEVVMPRGKPCPL